RPNPRRPNLGPQRRLPQLRNPPLQNRRPPNMISRRTVRLFKWSLLLPAGFLGMLLSDWHWKHKLSQEMPGWRYIDARTPWYFDCFGYVFFLGCLLTLLAFLSFLWDRFPRVHSPK